MMKCILATLSLSAIVVAAGPAYGDPADIEPPFLIALNQAGITYADAGQAVTAGQTMCDLVDRGKHGKQLVAALQKHNDALTTEHARQFMAIALQVYCPQNLEAGMSDPAPKKDE
ncbi:MAG TPA: DUF732 domain-containing protein [Mycobacterium sp.]